MHVNKDRKPPWEVCIKGKRCGEGFEIALVRRDNVHGKKSYGWFDENKLLISHNGGPCQWPLVPIVWDRLVEVAHEICHRLNQGESPGGEV